MSTLTADRIGNHATRLGLTHLTDTLTELVERAETGQMGYLDFVDLSSKKKSDCARAGGSATR